MVGQFAMAHGTGKGAMLAPDLKGFDLLVALETLF